MADGSPNRSGKSLHNATKSANAAHDPKRFGGMVNIPPHFGSTILFDSLEEFLQSESGKYPKPTYGRYGTPTTLALEDAICELEGANHCILTASGVSAITTALMSVVSSGDHLLVADNVYGPTRSFCQFELKKLGVETTFFDPLTSAEELSALFQPNTKALFVESPGSLTFEVSDTPALAQCAHDKGALVISDSTYGALINFPAFELGIDLSIHSLTKYVGGHSDIVMGAVTCRDAAIYSQLKATHKRLGACSNGHDAYLATRGLRTLPMRLKQHEENALTLVEWLQTRPEVQTILHPALPSCPGHAHFTRDFKGANGLFSFTIGHYSTEALGAMLNPLRFFGMGYSWGGYESLLIPSHPHQFRSAKPWSHDGILLRMHVGLESPQDLIDDLEQGFARLNAASSTSQVRNTG